MNLGQLIDPELVRQGLPDRPPPAPSPAPPMGHYERINGITAQVHTQPVPPAASGTMPIGKPVVSRRPREFTRGTTLRILKLFDEADAPLTSGDLYRGLGSEIGRERIAALLSNLYQRKSVQRFGDVRPYKYRITSLGRSRIQR